MIAVGKGPYVAAARENRVAVAVAEKTATFEGEVRSIALALPFVAVATADTLHVHDLDVATSSSLSARGVHTLAAEYRRPHNVHVCFVAAADDCGVNLYYYRRRTLATSREGGVFEFKIHVEIPGLVPCAQPAFAMVAPNTGMLVTAHERGLCCIRPITVGANASLFPTRTGLLVPRAAKEDAIQCGLHRSFFGIHALICSVGRHLYRYTTVGRGWALQWKVACPGPVECLRLQADNAAVACQLDGGVVMVYNGRGEVEGRWRCDAGWTLGAFSPLQSKPDRVRMEGGALESDNGLRRLAWNPRVHRCFPASARRRARATMAACRDVPVEVWMDRVVPAVVE